MMELRQSRAAWPAVVLVTIATCALLAGSRGDAAAAGAPPDRVQASSASFTLNPAGFTSVGGKSSSAGFGLNGDVGSGPGPRRSSSASFDIVSGFGGAFFSSRTQIQLTTAGGTFLSAAFPVSEANNAPTSVLSELGGYDIKHWRLGHWSPTDSAYMEVGNAAPLNLATLDRGQGYWLITKSAAGIASLGLPAPQEPFIIPLVTHPGGTALPTRAAWNQIGNPFLFPVDVATIIVFDGISAYLLTDPGNTLTDNVVKGWTGSGYADVTVMNGRTAYWVRTKQGTSNVKLFIPYVATTTGTPEPALQKPAGSDWAIALVAHQGERACEPMLVGAGGQVEGPQNPLVLGRAPAPPDGDYLSLHMPRGDWGGDYVADFRPAASRMSWDFVVTGAQVPGEVAIDVKAFDLPSGTTLRLTDRVTGEAHLLVPGGSITVASHPDGRAYRIEAASNGEATVADGGPAVLRYAYPNPFRGSTGLTFSLPGVADVAADIFDLQGRHLRSISRSGLSAGERVLVWDGRDESGRTVGSGVYLARWRAGAAAGVRRLVKVD